MRGQDTIKSEVDLKTIKKNIEEQAKMLEKTLGDDFWETKKILQDRITKEVEFTLRSSELNAYLG